MSGLVPKEYSSGASRWQGSITKIGNAHIRHVLVESAWAYRHRSFFKGQIRVRQEGQDPEAQRIAWKAQHRLNQKYNRITSRGKLESKLPLLLPENSLDSFGLLVVLLKRNNSKSL